VPHKAVVQLFGGSTTVTLEADSPKELIQQLSFYSQLPHQCPICKADLAFSYREAKSYKFWSLVCNGAIRHESTFGQYKADSSLFYKPQWEVSQRGRSDEEEDQAPPVQPPKPQPQQTKPTPATALANPISETQLGHLKEVLRVAKLTTNEPAIRFVSYLLSLPAPFTDWKQLESHAVGQLLERLGWYTSPTEYKPDPKAVDKAKKRWAIEQTPEQKFDDLGKGAA
jgi:hypothetical protein